MAFQYSEKEKREATALFDEGVKYLDQENYAKAVEIWTKAASRSVVVPETQFNLGICYEGGGGVPHDIKKAFEWYEKAAEQGMPKAELRIGVMYYFGNGVPKDVSKAAKWYEKAAAHGDPNAQVFIGNCYEYGEGVPKDG